jgi:xanthine/uracil permease
MQFQYALDEQPPVWKSVLFGLQWAAIAVPSVITVGRAIDSLHVAESPSSAGYLQRLLLVTAITMAGQVLVGHRLPVIAGPATVLLIGVLGSGDSSSSAVHTSIIIGGVFLTLLAVSGLLKHLRKLFTDNVVAVVLLLIAFTLAPTVLKLMLAAESGGGPLANLTFALVLILAMFVAHRFLTGIWRATVIVSAMGVGTLAYVLIFPQHLTHVALAENGVLSGFMSGLTLAPQVQIGVLLSFLVCYVALSINDLGSIQSMNRLLEVKDMDQRVSRGITVTGLANVLSGVLGVVGPVNYSLSPGVVMSTGCASRFTLLPAAAIVGLLAFLPTALGFVSSIPSVVIGCVLLYILTSQVSAGLMVAFERQDGGRFQFDDGLIIGLPVLLGTIIAFLPPEVLETFPTVLKPTLGNGFVVGVVAALALEHVLLRKRADSK